MLFENMRRRLSFSNELKEAKENKLENSTRGTHKPFSIASMLNPVPLAPKPVLPSLRPLGEVVRHEVVRHEAVRQPIFQRKFTPQASLSPSPSPESVYSRVDGDGKMDRLQNGTLVERRCGDCGANSTSGHWSQDTMVVGGYICQKCYRRRKRAEKDNKPYNIRNKHCYDCKVEDSVVWFRHFSIAGKYICSPCHNAKTGIETSSCHACGTHKSTKWSTDSKGNTVCRKCHRQLRSVALVLTGFAQ